jgi:hypothetical protein
MKITGFHSRRRSRSCGKAARNGLVKNVAR